MQDVQWQGNTQKCVWVGLDLPFSPQKSCVSTSLLLPASLVAAGTLWGAKLGCGLPQGSAHRVPCVPSKAKCHERIPVPCMQDPGVMCKDLSLCGGTWLNRHSVSVLGAPQGAQESPGKVS